MRNTSFILKSGHVLPIAIAVFLLPVILVQIYVLQHTDGVFSYPLDDSFIHLAIARSIAFHHVWGISGHEFASASSSIIYPLILAGTFVLFGAHTIIGFLINLLAALILLRVMQRWLARQELSPLAQLLILLSVILLTPLPVLVICGMEHTLQFLFCWLFITGFSDRLATLVRSGEKNGSLHWSIYLFGALVTATRYEGATLVAVACLALAVHRKWFLAFQLGIISLLPILLFGIYALYQGSYFIPNSVMLKSGAPPMTFDGLYNFFTRDLYTKLSFSIVGYNSVATQRLLFLLPLTYLIFLGPVRRSISYRTILILLITAVLVHLSFTGYVHFPRYEAWLIGCSTAIIGTLLAKHGAETFRAIAGKASWLALAGAALLLFPLLIRSKDAFRDIGQACINIYEQQYQMGRFLHRHYNTTPVAVGDIGAVSYFTEANNLDLVGLANIQVARSKKNFYYTPDFLDWLNRQDKVQIAIVYDIYNHPDLLRRWSKIATWQIPNNVTCGDDIVSFYAVDKGAAPGLKKNLLEFQPSLPTDVVVRYY